ncbi:hypothetical protein EV193_110212 [Herbihabitans rhizosphaerae]|uniref:DUF4232 domain-containing protein n=1 Tax=Herbihabitans rhizosphaerae TaxID=1872711 RepID=A0A4Q7KFR8_9PSEU|nr:hypothetical protein [Herbihabitans rhizosphaerae]RZS34062.1 hypothetical protein EV193_110212 [Herbihabitans rhizosphaerae]
MRRIATVLALTTALAAGVLATSASAAPARAANCQGPELVLNLLPATEKPDGKLTAPLYVGVKPGATGCTLRGYAEAIVLLSGSEPINHPLERDTSTPVTDVPIDDDGQHAFTQLTWTPAAHNDPEPQPNGVSVRLEGVHYGFGGLWNGGKVRASTPITHTALAPVRA